MKLYELNTAIENFEFQIDEETGEILNMSGLEALQMERDEKIENVALYYKNIKSDVEQFKAEENKLAERREREEKKAEALKNFLACELNGEKFRTIRVEISFRKSESVEITDAGAIPKEYMVIQEPKPDKVGIKKAIKAGEDISGAEISEHSNIQIK